MAFHHRKLLNLAAIDPNITEYCSPLCDPNNNPDGNCPFNCISFCFTLLLQNAPPLPLPFPPPPTAIIYTAAPHKPQHLSLFLIVSLAVLATAFFLFTCYTAYKFYCIWYNSRRRRRRLERTGPDQDRAPDNFLDEDQRQSVVDHHVWYIRTVGLQPSVINAITVVKYKNGDGIIEGTDCSVCLSEFRDDETLRLLPKCNHAFHIPCIDTWLRSHTNCPLCRAGIVKNPPEEVTVDESGQAGEARIESNRASEIRIGLEEGDESRAQAQLGVPKIDGDDEVQLQYMRRSVSLEENSEFRTNQRPLNEMCIQTGPCTSMTRSVSCSDEVFLSR